MDHNNIDVISDLILPLTKFLEKFTISTHNEDRTDVMHQIREQFDSNGPSNI